MSFVSILPTIFQPQPVFSSSNGWSFLPIGPQIGDVHRLEELVIVGTHETIAAVVDGHLHAVEFGRDFGRLDRIRLLSGLDEHAYLINGARIEQRDTELGAKRLLELLGRCIRPVRQALGNLKHLSGAFACLTAVGPPMPPA